MWWWRGMNAVGKMMYEVPWVLVVLSWDMRMFSRCLEGWGRLAPGHCEVALNTDAGGQTIFVSMFSSLGVTGACLSCSHGQLGLSATEGVYLSIWTLPSLGLYSPASTRKTLLFIKSPLFSNVSGSTYPAFTISTSTLTHILSRTVRWGQGNPEPPEGGLATQSWLVDHHFGFPFM